LSEIQALGATELTLSTVVNVLLFIGRNVSALVPRVLGKV